MSAKIEELNNVIKIEQETEKFSQADELIKAAHDMNNNELKFMFYALSRRKVGQLHIETTVKEVLKKLKKDDGGMQYETYMKVMKSIRTKSDMEVCMKASRLSEKKRKELHLNEDDVVIVAGNLINTITDVKNGKVIIDFKEEFLPLLDDLKNEHTWIYFEQVSKLDRKYSPRFYEFCKMRLKNHNKVSFIWYLNSGSESAPSMRNFLNIGNKYPDWRNFKRRVIDNSIEEINEQCTDISVIYEPLKNPSVYAIKLTIFANKNEFLSESQNGAQLSLFEKQEKEEEQYDTNEDFTEEIKNLNLFNFGGYD